MKTLTIHTLLLLALVLCGASAQIPRTINYQGRAADASGPLEDQTRQMILRIYDASNSILWIEQQDVAFQTGGVFTVALGRVNPFPASMLFDAPYTLGVTIQGFNSGNELPRIPLRSVPYAFHALVADNLQGPATAGGNTTTRPTLHLVANSATQNGYALVTQGVDSTSAHYVAGTNADTARTAPGAYYRDNAPIAWATVDADGSTVAEFGLSRVSYNDTVGGYVFELYNEVSIGAKPPGPAISVLVTSYGGTDPGIPTIGQWSPYIEPSGGTISARKFVVRIFFGTSGQSGRAPFSIQVFGRPK